MLLFDFFLGSFVFVGGVLALLTVALVVLILSPKNSLRAWIPLFAWGLCLAMFFSPLPNYSYALQFYWEKTELENLAQSFSNNPTLFELSNLVEYHKSINHTLVQSNLPARSRAEILQSFGDSLAHDSISVDSIYKLRNTMETNHILNMERNSAGLFLTVFGLLDSESGFVKSMQGAPPSGTSMSLGDHWYYWWSE